MKFSVLFFFVWLSGLEEFWLNANLLIKIDFFSERRLFLCNYHFSIWLNRTFPQQEQETSDFSFKKLAMKTWKRLFSNKSAFFSSKSHLLPRHLFPCRLLLCPSHLYFCVFCHFLLSLSPVTWVILIPNYSHWDGLLQLTITIQTIPDISLTDINYAASFQNFKCFITELHVFLLYCINLLKPKRL